MELLVLLLFGIILLLSILFSFSILIALLTGMALFIFYALLKGYAPKAVIRMLLDGISKAKNILVSLSLIGILTAMWRCSGTIPSIVSYSAGFLNPRLLYPMMFLLTSLVSFLTGTSFGTGATMGVICSSVAAAMGLDPVITGGAILSGCYFGDRCSPVSTSMLLTADLTHTDPYGNIRRMFFTAVIPFGLTVLLFVLLGLQIRTEGTVPDFLPLFSGEVKIHPVCLVPAVLILILALMKQKVKPMLLASILAALLVALLFQKRSLTELLPAMLFGYRAASEEIKPLIDGGGLLSMVRCVGIVCISSAFSGILEQTDLLKGLTGTIEKMAEATNAFTAILVTSVFVSAASCNQTLSIILTVSLCQNLVPEKELLASWLEDTVVVIAPLIPWSIAGSTVLNMCGLPIRGMLCSFYLILLPLTGLVRSYLRNSSR